MPKKAKEYDIKITKLPKTTIRLVKGDVVRIHVLNKGETLNRYLNRLIREDILKNGDEYVIKKYFKEAD